MKDYKSWIEELETFEPIDDYTKQIFMLYPNELNVLEYILEEGFLCWELLKTKCLTEHQNLLYCIEKWDRIYKKLLKLKNRNIIGSKRLWEILQDDKLEFLNGYPAYYKRKFLEIEKDLKRFKSFQVLFYIDKKFLKQLDEIEDFLNNLDLNSLISNIKSKRKIKAITVRYNFIKNVMLESYKKILAED